MIGGLLAILVVVGLFVMIGIAALLATTANRSENNRRVREYRRDPPGPCARAARQRQGEQIELCMGVCIASQWPTLTGAYYRTAEEEQAVRQACEWTGEDQARFNADYNPIEIDLPAAAPIEVPNWPGVGVRRD